MATSAATTVRHRSLIRDPMLVLPVVVVAGLVAGRLGVEAHVAGARIATDLALAWTLAARSSWSWSGRAGVGPDGRSPQRPSRFSARISSGRPRALFGRSVSCSRGCGSHSSSRSCSPSQEGGRGRARLASPLSARSQRRSARSSSACSSRLTRATCCPSRHARTSRMRSTECRRSPARSSACSSSSSFCDDFTPRAVWHAGRRDRSSSRPPCQCSWVSRG